MADETPVLVFYIENTQPYNVIDITEVTIPFYVEITDLAHDSDLIEIEDLPIPAVACYIENSKVFNITMDSSGRDGKDGLPGKDGIGLPGKDGASITFESLTPEQLALLLQPATDAAADLYETITQLQLLINNTVFNNWFFLDLDGNVGTNYNLYSTKGVSAYGVGVDGGGGTGGGLIQTVYGLSGLGGTYDNSILTNTFNAYTINLINARLIAVEDGGSHIGLYEPKNANIQSHILSNSNPHNVTKELLNLGNVLNVASYSKSESDTLLLLKLDAITFNDLFEKVNIGTLETPKYAIKAKYDFYSIGEVSAFGAGSGTGGSSGGGLIQTVYGNSSLGGTFNNATLTDTFNAYTINQINNRLTVVESSIPNINWGTLTSGYRALTINGITYSLAENSHTHAEGALSPTDKTYIELLKTFFEWDATNSAIKAKYDFYSTGGVSAYGLGSTGGGGGGSMVIWGTEASGAIPLTVEGITKTLSLASHTHNLSEIGITGLTTNYLTKYNGSTFVNSQIYDNGSNIGLGTTTPVRKLTIYEGGTSNYQLRLGASASYYYEFGRDTSNGLLHFYGNQSGANGYIFDGVNGERMRINESGNVGIGTTTPTAKLDVSGTGKFKDDILMTFNTWSHATDKNSLNKFLKLFDIDTAGNLVVKTNLYSMGEVSAYKSGTGVSGLTLMADMDANGKNINNLTSISKLDSKIRLLGSSITFDVEEYTNQLTIASDGIYSNVDMVASSFYANSTVYAPQFKFGSWSFKEVSGNMVIYYNGTAKATIQSGRINSNL